MRMGRALGTRAIVQRMLRKAMRSITATPATVMTKLDHWSRKLCFESVPVSRTKKNR